MVHGIDAELQRPTVELLTGTSGSEARLVLERTLPVDLRNQSLELWLRVEPETALSVSAIVVKVASGVVAFENVAYQEIVSVGGPRPAREAAYLQSFIKPGQWVRVTLGPPSFEGRLDTNFAAVDYRALQDFEVAVTAHQGQQARVKFAGMRVVGGDPRFPDGVVSICFDDGLARPYELARATLASHDFGATAYVIRDLLEPASGDPSYLSLRQLGELQSLGWEIAAHANSVADHNAPYGFVSLSDAALAADVEAEVRWLRGNGFNGAADIALPQGYSDSRVERVLVRSGGFRTIRTADFRSVETLPVADPHRLRARLYDPTQVVGPPERPGSIMWRIEQIATYGGWLILGFHDMTTRGSSVTAPIENEGTAILDSDFAELIGYIAHRGVPVRTVGEVAHGRSWLSPPTPRRPNRAAIVRG